MTADSASIIIPKKYNECRESSMDQYKLQAEKGNGTFSVVFMALSLKTGKHVAIKCMKKKFDSVEKIKKLKEIQALNILSNHENIIKLIEVLFDEPTGKLALVFELMEMNLYEALKNKRKPLTLHKIKYYMFQVLKAIEFMHRKNIFHRDIKPQNILVTDDLVKVADLGSCKGRHSQQPYTQYISTRWYRAPECLMTDGYYNEKMDIWGFGCVLFQLITKVPLFPGRDELDQVHRIHNVFGTPKPQILERFKSRATHMDFNFPAKKGIGLEKLLPPNTGHDIKDLLEKLLAYDANQRITAEEALRHEFFAEFSHLIDKKKDFRSTISIMRQNHTNEKSEEKDSESVRLRSIQKKGGKDKKKNGGSRNNLDREQEVNGVLPRLPALEKTNNSTVSGGEYKKTFYGKRNSNDLNLGVVQGKKY